MSPKIAINNPITHRDVVLRQLININNIKTKTFFQEINSRVPKKMI
jgi:hypothetical protein